MTVWMRVQRAGGLRARVRSRGLVWGAGVLLASCAGWARAATCPVAAATTVPAEMAYGKGDLEDAELLFQQAVAKEPHDDAMAAGLVRTRLRLGKLDEAATTLDTVEAEVRQSAPLLTAKAELQLRRGQPWLANETLRKAEGIDGCYARLFLIRSRIARLDSMYATERTEIQQAYDLAPKDAEIRRAWTQVVSAAADVTSTKGYLATTTSVDPEVRQAADASVKGLMPLLSETSQTCQVQPSTETATVAMQPAMQDGKHVDGYRMEVQLGQTKAMLGVDTAASGVYVSQALADANGLTHKAGDPPGTVHADTIAVGPMVFKDCIVGVSETPFAGKAAGYIGTDLFENFLVTMNFPEAKLLLQPLPAVKTPVPGDRVKADELRGYSPVYHRQQYLLIPVELNRRERRLFVLDSGIRLSTMALPVAHLVSANQRTSPIKTVSGATLQIYRDSVDFEFADLLLRNRTGLLAMEPTAIEQHAGMEVGGLLGFDVLHAAVLHMDYRDGLVKVEFPDGEAAPAGQGQLLAREGSGAVGGGVERVACAQEMAPEVPAGATIETRNTGLWDAAHMKAGEAVTVKVIHAFLTPACRMEIGSLLYGHVTAASGKGGTPQLGLEFDRADCEGKGKRELPLKLVSVVAAPGEFVGMHTQMPAAIGGGRGRSIGDTLEAEQGRDDVQLNPEVNPTVVETSSVRGLANLKLKTDGGPSCSALLTSSNGTLRLRQETKFLLVMQDDAKQ